MLKLNLSVRYDNDLSQFYFEDFKNENHVLFFGDRSIDYCVIFENEEVKNAPYFKKSRLGRMKKSDLYEILNNVGLADYDLDNYTKAEIVDLLLQVTNESFYKSHYENSSYGCLEYDFAICGYCQGDYVKINKVGSAEWCEKSYSKEYLSNLFFDSPVSGKIELVELSESKSGFIDDCAENSIFEIYIDELLEDQYNYSKNEVISNFEKLNFAKLSDKIGELQNKYNLILKDYISSYLKDNLPENPEYSY